MRPGNALVKFFTIGIKRIGAQRYCAPTRSVMECMRIKLIIVFTSDIQVRRHKATLNTDISLLLHPIRVAVLRDNRKPFVTTLR